MSDRALKPLFVCYVPGLDGRRLDSVGTPFLSELRKSASAAEIRTLPSTELLPTMMTGVWPHQHGVWQVSLRPEFRTPRRTDLWDLVPDIVSTTLQCMRHLLDSSYDLPVVPHRRRRRFDLHRFKYTRRLDDDSRLTRFGQYPSLFGLLGSEASYSFTKAFSELEELAARFPTSDRRLEFLEMYALDLTQHWNLADAQRMADALERTDRFVRRVHENCERRGVRFMLLVDHGQERVVGTIPLLQTVREAGVPEQEYSYFVELASARFWFHTNRARERIAHRLRSLAYVTLLTWGEMHEHHVSFEDDTFGELYAMADAGRIFFPHDFHQPLGNIFLGLTDAHQRQRLWNPLHSGNHGYLPHNASERGLMIAGGGDIRASRPEAQLIDVAPTILDLVGLERPSYMSGTPVFESGAASMR